jgi:hypothetical protein
LFILCPLLMNTSSFSLPTLNIWICLSEHC